MLLGSARQIWADVKASGLSDMKWWKGCIYRVLVRVVSSGQESMEFVFKTPQRGQNAPLNVDHQPSLSVYTSVNMEYFTDDC